MHGRDEINIESEELTICYFHLFENFQSWLDSDFNAVSYEKSVNSMTILQQKQKTTVNEKFTKKLIYECFDQNVIHAFNQKYFQWTCISHQVVFHSSVIYFRLL